MILEELAENIFNVNFPTQEEMASTFLRFQEHFESPEYRGKVFTLEEFTEWYIANSPDGQSTGKFTYYEDWTGFNIPSNILDPFYEGQFDPLSDQEKALLNLLTDIKGTAFYILGTYGKKPTNLRHETAHGLFYINSEYRAKALAIVNEVDPTDRAEVNKYLSKSDGYHPDVWDDEAHTYLMAGLDKLERAGIDVSKFADVSTKLNQLFDEYYTPTQPELIPS